MVVSGINAGANMGDDVLYSGTVAAAMEGVSWGFRRLPYRWRRINPSITRPRRVSPASWCCVCAATRCRRTPFSM